MSDGEFQELFDTVGQDSLDVPEHAYNIWVEAWGPGGGDGGVPGGTGGYAAGYLDEAEHETLHIFVGGAGQPNGASGGFNGGGDATGGAGSGGGASDVRLGGTTLTDRRLVAGGGAGSGSNSSNPGGGDGGGLEGEDGEDEGGREGEGGTQSAGGSGGSSFNNGSDGSFGEGGDGSTSGGERGGAGGAGYYGGGGAGSADSGGSGGGGGSSYIAGVTDGQTTTGGGNDSDGEILVTFDIELGLVDDITAVEERDNEIDLAWTSPDGNRDGMRLYRDTDSPVAADATNEIADLGPDAESYTDADEELVNGQQYYYVLESYRGGDYPDEELGEEGTATTTLPDLAAIALEQTGQNEIRASWTDVSDNGFVRVEYRKVGASTWESHDTVVLGEEQTEIGGLDPATDYEVRARTETDDREGQWVSESITVELLPPGVAVDGVTESAVSLQIEPGDGVDELRIERRDELDNRRDTGYGEWAAIETIGGETTAYTDEGLRDNWSYEYRVVAIVNPEETSEPVEATTDIDYPEGVSVELRRGDGEKLLVDPEQIIDIEELVREPSAMSNVAIAIPEARQAEDWQLSELLLWSVDDDGSRELHFRGEFLEQTDRPDAGETVIGGPDVLKKLERGDARRVVENIEAWRALQEYADEELPEEWSVEVFAPLVETIDEGLVVQVAETTAEFEDATTIGETDPFEVSDSEVPTLQSCFTTGGQDYDRGNAPLSFVNEEFEGSSPDPGFGAAAALSDVGDYAEWDFEIEYDWPAEEWDLAIRRAGRIDEPGFIDVEWTIDGQDATIFAGGTNEDVLWRERLFGNAGTDTPALEPGVHTIKAEVVDDPGDGVLWIDVVAPHDRRYDYNFDSEVTTLADGTNVLDGPELFPDRADLLFEPFDQSFNVDRAHLDVTMDDTSGGQRLQATIDDGTTWLPDDGSEENTESVTADFGAAELFGTVVQARVGMGRYSPDGTRDETPREGYAGQTLSSWQLAIDTNDIAVIDELELFGSHFENWQRLEREAGHVTAAIYDESDLILESFTPGHPDSVREADWTRLSGAEREHDLIDYGNVQVVYGGVVEEGGEEVRLRAEARAETRIDEEGELPAPPIRREEVTNEEQLANIARTELGRRIAETEPEGPVPIAPASPTPGYAYEIDLFDEPALLGQVSVGLEGTDLQFGLPDDLAAALVGIRTEVSETKRIL